MKKLKLEIVRISPEAQLPEYQYPGDSGADICSIINLALKPLERKTIPTGLKVEVPKGYELQVRSRSGVALDDGIIVLNSPGTIGSSYRGEIKIILINLSQELYEIKIGQRIAQVVLMPVYFADFEEVGELSISERGDEGFGSTKSRRLRRNA